MIQRLQIPSPCVHLPDVVCLQALEIYCDRIGIDGTSLRQEIKVKSMPLSQVVERGETL